jgi:hypothetical protein
MALLNRLRVRDEAGYRMGEAAVDAALEDHRHHGACVWRGDQTMAAAPLRRNGGDAVVIFVASSSVDRAGERLLVTKVAEAARSVDTFVRGEAT